MLFAFGVACTPVCPLRYQSVSGPTHWPHPLAPPFPSALYHYIILGTVPIWLSRYVCIDGNVHFTVLYCLAVMPCLLLCPPPYFRTKLLGFFYLHYMPPSGRSSRFVVLQGTYACCKCRRVVFVYQVCRK